MSILWIIRGSILASLFIGVGIGGHMLRNREKHPTVAESKKSNIAGVVWYVAGCCLSAGLLPPDVNVFSKPAILLNSTVVFGFPFVGIASIITGLSLASLTVRQRKVLGMQDTRSGLITNGTYAIFRHPIYVGMICISLGVALITLNWDGMMVFPLIVLLNFLEAKSEENNDLRRRFGKEYEVYKHKVRIFGPVWFWLVWFFPVGFFVLAAAT
jgi:protein-S-isoprenylcysteine O-methyltransferase Ste14